MGGGHRPAAVLVVSGDLQTGTVGQELPQPLVVKVVDEAGRPVRDQLVNFRVMGPPLSFTSLGQTIALLVQARDAFGNSVAAPVTLVSLDASIIDLGPPPAHRHREMGDGYLGPPAGTNGRLNPVRVRYR